MEQMRERVARAIAPFLEGGREFDKMPVNRLQLREWARQAMCGFNDATQDDAYEAADALQPEIDRRVAEERAALLGQLREAVKNTPALTVQLIRHENYSGEHREWKEPITFPQNAAFYETVLEAIIQAMLAQFEKEQQP